MQLVALKYFVAVADHGSFTAAAERLGLSASTLTRSVSTLEDNLGLTLFERSLRGVALAPGRGTRPGRDQEDAGESGGGDRGGRRRSARNSRRSSARRALSAA